MTRIYLAYGVLIESNLPLPELREPLVRSPARPNYLFRLLPTLSGVPQDYDWFHHWTLNDGSVWISCARYANCFVLRFNDEADFFVTPKTRTIECAPRPDVPEEIIRHWFLDQ